MKEYFEAEVAEVVRRIKHYRKPESFVFGVFTDMHIHPDMPQTMSTMYHTLDTLGAVHEKCGMDAIFFLGDIPKLNREYSPNTWSEEMVDSSLRDIYSRMRAITQNSFMIAGNHDGKHAGLPEQKRFYESCIAPSEPDCRIVKTEGKGYYYLDFPEKKVRCICLLSCFSEEGKAVFEYMPDQLRWLRDDALRVQKGTNVFLFGHIPPVCNYPAQWSQSLVRMMGAYKNREVCRIGGESFDFTCAEGELKAMHVGDGHYDWINKDGFACPTVETASAAVFEVRLKTPQWWMPHEAVSPRRCPDSVTEVAWDAVIFDPEDNDLVILRFGAGEDRYMHCNVELKQG